MYRNIISHIRDTTKLPHASALSVYIYTLQEVKAACGRDVQRLSVGTLLFRFPVNDHDWKINLNLIRLGLETKPKLQLLTYSFQC